MSALKPDTTYFIRPEQYGLTYREFFVKAADNSKVNVWFFPAQTSSIPPDSVAYYFKNPIRKPYIADTCCPKPTIVVAPGDAVNMVGSLVYAKQFTSEGYNVVTFDWRGFGQSEPMQVDTALLCYTEFLLDFHAVVNTIADLPEVDAGNIGVYGGSTGAYLSFAVAYTNPNIKCFAGRALLTCFDDFLPYLYKDKGLDETAVKKPEDYPESLYPIHIAPYFTKPAFLFVGAKDTRTPVWMSEKLYEKLPGEKELWIVEDAVHGGPEGPEFINMEAFVSKVTGFYNKYLK